ncbi:LANO_0B08680g1_1 [Lachancea nothofagi CBS 11611]|uniref:LANO_0B08680g1_1 n=1 Tax=Lachancea nothofagi CBS 11611 TaxID=1266666 RepID=A0A1G4J144_9SACH|nr:LANO_0B08680g1_1 [Lachancea nothofagi CBS 11611]
MSFNEIPIIDLSKAFNPQTKPQFLIDLRDALINVGFMLLINYEKCGPSHRDFEDIKQQAVEFFACPDHVKKKCEMIHSPHFLGYTRFANEITAGKVDLREQIDLATELPPPKDGEPLYKQIEGPNLWPDERETPNFRPVVTHYIDVMTQLSTIFRNLVCEAIGLESNGFDSLFKENQQCKMKLIAYPEVSYKKSPATLNESKTEVGQGVGPHRDSDFLTYIYQASEHKGSLQVQNFQGKWVSVDNTPGSLVVNVGQTLEAITDGVCKATIHRVVSPEQGSGTRMSIPFFQTIDLDSHKSIVPDIPPEILDMKDERDKHIGDWGVDVGFQFSPDVSKYPIGYTVFRNRIKSHRDVAAKWYPEILKQVLGKL